jgi:type IV pilus assembly protein PilP
MDDLRSQKRPLRYLALWLFIATTLVGCGEDIQDLQLYVEEVKARSPGKVGSIPVPEPPPKFDYQAESLRDPFDVSELTDINTITDGDVGSTIRPPGDHRKHYLETFPLDTLRMVGTLSQGNELWALIKTPDSTIQRVKAGDYMGQNYGKVVGISDEKITLIEIISDGFEGFKERDTLVALME